MRFKGLVDLGDCFVTNEVPLRFQKLINFSRNQKNDIYNSRLVPGLSISKKFDLLRIYMFLLHSVVMSEVSWGFGELSSIPSGSEK